MRWEVSSGICVLSTVGDTPLPAIVAGAAILETNGGEDAAAARSLVLLGRLPGYMLA